MFEDPPIGRAGEGPLFALVAVTPTGTDKIGSQEDPFKEVKKKNGLPCEVEGGLP